MIRPEDIAVLEQCRGRIVLGFSGGIDSSVLLHLLHSLRQHLSQPIVALHVNHGLNAEADSWQTKCAKFCQDLGVEFIAKTVSVAKTGSLESAARDARYAAFEERLGEDDLLLLAHHRDDQFETALLKLLRGDSPFGLQGMPKRRMVGKASLLRPILHCTRKEVEAYASAHHLDWLEDDSNQETMIDRNYLRHKVMPLLTSRWPQLATSLSGALERNDEVVSEFDALARSDLVSLSLSSYHLSLLELAKLSLLRQRNLLCLWLRQGGIKQMPSRRMLKESLRTFFDAEPDAKPLLSWQGVELRRFANCLYRLPVFNNPDKEAITYQAKVRQDKARVVLNNGTLVVSRLVGSGLSMADSSQLSIRFRQGGEKMRMHHAGQGHKSLKNIFQENRIPLFIRDYLPLIYLEDELVAIAAMPALGLPLIVAPHFEAGVALPGRNFEWLI